MSTRSPQTRLQKRLVSSRHFLLSGFEDREKKELAEKIAGLGGLNLMSETFKPACTHLVCGRLSRSEKFLCACAMGRWILHPKYVRDSAERGEWLQEEEYEWVNYPRDGLSEFMNAGRRCRFNVEAFKSLPFSGWRVAVVVRGSRKSSIYSRLLSCGGAEIYKLSLPVGNRSRVADLLTYVFVGERNIPDVLHLIEYGIMCLRPEFIGDYILQDPPPDPVDYLVKLEASKRSSELGTVDINDSTADILFSQSGSSQSTPSSQSLTGSHVNTPWGSSHSTPQGTPLKNVQNKSTKPVAVSPLVLIDFSQTPDSPSSALEPAQIILNDSSRKRKMVDNLDKAVRQLKRCKMTHRGDLWHPTVFTGLSAEEDQEPVEIVLPFPASLEGMILACFEEDSSNPNFFLAGLDMVVSSISNRQSPTASIIKVILHGMLEVPGTNSFQTDLIQYRCYDVLMKILNLHPPTTPRAIDLYQAVLNNTDDVTCDQRNIIRSFLQARSDKDGPLFPKGRILLLQFIVAALEVNLQHYLDRIDKGEMGTRKLRGCMFAQTLWPGSTLMSFNSTCKELVLLFGLCITEDMDSLFKRDLVKLTTSLICMAVLLVQYVETGQRVALYEPIVPSPTAASLLHEATRQVPSTLSNELLRTILRNLTPSWITVHFCYLLLRNLDDYLLLQELPTDDVDLREIVTKFFFLLPTINSRQSNILQRPHQKKVDHRLPEEPRLRTRKTLRTASGKENESTAGLSGVRNVNKRNVKGETPLQVACIKNNLKKVRELLQLADVDVNTCDYAGWTPLHEACNHGHLEIVKELLNFVPAKTVDHFFSPGNRKRKKVNLLAVTTELITPLHDAVMNNRLDVCKILLQHGGPVLLERKTAQNQTPLDLAPTSQMRELLQSFTENRSLRSFSQGSFSSDCPADSPPSEYLYEQVLGEKDHGFADREECAKYIGVISTLVHAYLQVIDYNQIQAIMEGKTTLSMKGVKMKQSGGQDIIHNGTETSSPQCQVYSNHSNQLTPQKSRSCSDTLLIQRDFKTACKLSMHVERFTDHLQRITRKEDFACLQFDLCMLTQTAASCQMSVK